MGRFGGRDSEKAGARDMPEAQDAPLGGAEGAIRDIGAGKHKRYTHAQRTFAEHSIKNNLQDPKGQVSTTQALGGLRKLRRDQKGKFT